MATTRYAERTTVSDDRSQAEIAKLLRAHGATGFVGGWQGDKAAIMFELKGRRYRMALPLPDRAEFRRTPTGRVRSSSQVETEYQQEIRRRWRALALIVKAKLEAVASGIVSLEDELLSYTVLPSGETVGERLIPMIGQAYSTGDLPPLLPGH